MSNKGFTLIELIAVIIILGVIALIAIPIFSDNVDSSRKRAYNEQINRIIKITKDYVISSEEFLFNDEDEFEISLNDLKQAGYLEDEDLINPITEKVMDGCIKVVYNENRNLYDYTYDETCS